MIKLVPIFGCFTEINGGHSAGLLKKFFLAVVPYPFEELEFRSEDCRVTHYFEGV